MRIVHVNTQDVAGGAAKMARLIAARERAAGMKASLLVARRHGPGGFARRFDPSPHPALGPFMEEAGLQYLHFTGSFKLPSREPMASADLVHLHNLHYGYFNPLSLPAISRAKPCLWTLHDLHPLTGFCNYPVDCPGWLSGCGDCRRVRMNAPDTVLDAKPQNPAKQRGIAITHQAKALAYSHSRLTLVCPSRWVQDQAERSILAGHPSHVIPNGIETDVFTPGDKAAVRRELGIPQEAPVAGGVAAYGVFDNPIKGGPLVLEAMHRVWASRPDTLFLNVGGFGQGPDPRVVNIPFVEDPASLSRLYAAMDVFVHASLAETFCLVAAEAMACGVPVAAQDLGPLPEVVRHGLDGLLTPAGDAAALAASIGNLLSDAGLRRAMGQNGRGRAEAEFGLDLMVARYIELSHQVVEERRTAPSLPAPLPLGRLPSLIKSAVFSHVEHAPGEQPDWVGITEAFVEEQPEEARPAMRAAMDKVRETARVFELRGRGRFEEALEILSRLNADWPEDTALWRTRGVTLGLMGRRAEAMEAFRVCLEAHPPQSDALLNICDMWRAAGDRAKALEALEAFATVDPYLRGFNWRKGLLLQDAGEHRRAALAFLRELRLHGSPEAREPLAISLTTMGKTGLASCLREGDP